MSKLRHELQEKVMRADNLLNTVETYLQEVGSSYLKRVPEMADRFAILHSVVKKVREGLRKLYEEM